MNQFVLKRAESGEWTAMHKETGVLVHSAVSPQSEAERAALSIQALSDDPVILIGVGLGYLARELASRGMSIQCYEPFADLTLHLETAQLQSGDAGEVFSGLELLADATSCVGTGKRTIIAPYVLALQSYLPQPLRELIAEKHVLTQSRKKYAPIIKRNIDANLLLWHKLPKIQLSAHQSPRLGVAVGAGPTLTACVETLCAARSKLLLVAASGAVPALMSAGIEPDWIVVLESSDAAERDLDFVSPASRLVVFPWSHPAALECNRGLVFAADEDDLHTHSGTSGIAAADLALKLTNRELFLVGMELSDADGEYATGALRESANVARSAPKFLVMRHAAEEWALQNDMCSIMQVVPSGVAPVRGMEPVLAGDFSNALHSRISARIQASV